MLGGSPSNSCCRSFRQLVAKQQLFIAAVCSCKRKHFVTLMRLMYNLSYFVSACVYFPHLASPVLHVAAFRHTVLDSQVGQPSLTETDSRQVVINLCSCDVQSVVRRLLRRRPQSQRWVISILKA